MTKIDEMCSVMQDFQRGKKVICRLRFQPEWVETTAPTWDWQEHEYRIKPEPREWWLIGGHSFITQEDAESWRSRNASNSTFHPIHVREVLEP
jgi:hypothetical protein